MAQSNRETMRLMGMLRDHSLMLPDGTANPHCAPVQGSGCDYCGRGRVVRRTPHWGQPRIPGCQEIVMAVECLPYPVGSVYYNWVGNCTIQTLWSYVIEPLRRCGIRTAMHESLIQAYPELKRVVTASGTNNGGAAWLKATGFKKNRETGDWEFAVKRGK